LVGETLAHFVGVDAAEVVALDGGFGGVAVTLPKGDGGGIFYGSFEEDGVDAVELEFFFHGNEKCGAQALAAVGFSGVESDDVGEWRIFFGEDEADDPVGVVVYGDQAIRAGEIEEVLESPFAVGDAGNETGLVEFVECGEVVGVVGADGEGHGRGEG
jgi:hypothetical protein